MTEPTCPGRCCAVFYTPFKPVEWAQRAARNPGADSEYIFDMLIPLTYEEAQARWLSFFGTDELPAGVQSPGQPREELAGYLYTCRHWDEETRLCGAYATRPGMCSNYPYGHTCLHGCGYKLSPEQEAAYKASLWDWTGWEWDAAAGGYRYTRGQPAEPTPGDNWSWDGEVLRPVDSADWRWDSANLAWARAH